MHVLLAIFLSEMKAFLWVVGKELNVGQSQ